MEKIKIHESKTLKLTNVLIKKVELVDDVDFPFEVLGMDNYIKTKGTISIGPIAQKMIVEYDENLTADILMEKKHD